MLCFWIMQLSSPISSIRNGEEARGVPRLVSPGSSLICGGRNTPGHQHSLFWGFVDPVLPLCSVPVSQGWRQVRSDTSLFGGTSPHRLPHRCPMRQSWHNPQSGCLPDCSAGWGGEEDPENLTVIASLLPRSASSGATPGDPRNIKCSIHLPDTCWDPLGLSVTQWPRGSRLTWWGCWCLPKQQSCITSPSRLWSLEVYCLFRLSCLQDLRSFQFKGQWIKNGGDICVCLADSFCCAAELTTL